jgi:hypothetical protein
MFGRPVHINISFNTQSFSPQQQRQTEIPISSPYTTIEEIKENEKEDDEPSQRVHTPSGGRSPSSSESETTNSSEGEHGLSRTFRNKSHSRRFYALRLMSWN